MIWSALHALMYLFYMYVLFIKHNSASTCQQWWTKIFSTTYLWVPQHNRTNKEILHRHVTAATACHRVLGGQLNHSIFSIRPTIMAYDLCVTRAVNLFYHRCLRSTCNAKTVGKKEKPKPRICFVKWTLLLDAVLEPQNLTAKSEFLCNRSYMHVLLLQPKMTYLSGCSLRNTGKCLHERQ